jgi:hypothetical protein
VFALGRSTESRHGQIDSVPGWSYAVADLMGDGRGPAINTNSEVILAADMNIARGELLLDLDGFETFLAHLGELQAL